MTLRSRVLALLSSQPGTLMTRSRIASDMGLTPRERRALEGVLLSLLGEGLAETTHRRYRLARPKGTVAGTFHAARGGYGFLTPEPPGEEGDLFVPARHTLGAFEGDRVLAALQPARRPGASQEARIVKILGRSRKPVIGVVQGGLLLPVGGSSHPIPLGRGAGQEGQMAAVLLSEEERPTALRVFTLGAVDDPSTPIRAAQVRYGLSETFPPEVEAEAGLFPGRPSEEDLEGRTDFRGLLTVTIDPEDAKDFDDAVSLLPEGDGWRLYVHVADVSHYVRQDTAIDREARRRGNTTYLPGPAYHMLPKSLSGGLCSLRPGEERLTLTAEMVLDGMGGLEKASFHRGVIRSAARLSYEEAQAILEGSEGALQGVRALVASLHGLTERLFARFVGRGALDLDLPESSLRFGLSGRVEEVLPSVRLDSHRWIEHAMLLCNEAVARELSRRRAPALFRVHDDPAPEKLERLRPLLNALGLGSSARGDLADPFVLQAVLKRAEGHRAAKLVAYLVLRSMAQARYDPEILPHYGLALTRYCHFTSPIRRYPDLFVHRSLKAALWGDGPPRDDLQALADHCSRAEREADQAEREVAAWYQMAFLSDRLGETFEALVLSFTKFGARVELLDHLIEGICPFREVQGDFVAVDGDGLAARARRSGAVLRVGDAVRARLVRVDRLLLEAQFQLEDWPGPVSRGKPLGYNRRRFKGGKA